jgi:hypothetical protein
MRYQPMLLACTAFVAVLACGDGAVDPGEGGHGGGGQEMAARFEQLADSVEGEGYSPTADALRHAAEIVRLTGHATPVRLTINGQDRSFLAVAEQLDFPNLECTWPSDSGVVVPDDSTVVVPGDGGGVPGDSGVIVPTPEPGGFTPPDSGSGEGGPGECREVGTYSMRTLIAWEPANMAEVVRIVADLGSTEVERGVPDVMTGLPATEAPGADGETPPVPGDTAVGGGGGGYPGFMGEYLVRDVGSWWAAEGSQTNALQGIAGACTADRATFDWAEFRCDAAQFRFEFSMRVEPLRYDSPTGGDPPPEPASGEPEGSHELTLGSSDVAGVRLTVVAWTPPPLPPSEPPGEPPSEPRPDNPPPVDSTGVAGGS